MVKQRELGESNQKELTQKGTNIKKKSSHHERSSRRSTASRAECFLVGVGDLADGELARRLLQRLSGGVDGQVVRRPRCSELPRRFEPAASAFSPVGVVLGLGVVSQWGTVVVVPGQSSWVPGLSLGL